MTTILFLLGFFQCAQSFELAVAVGMQSTRVATDISTISTGSNSGYKVGVLGFSPLSNELVIRTGALFSRKKFDIIVGDKTIVTAIDYIDIPFTGLLMINEQVGFFGGMEFGIKFADTSQDENEEFYSIRVTNGLIYGVSAGGHFRFNKHAGIELSYLLGLSEVFPDFKNASGLVVTGVYQF